MVSDVSKKILNMNKVGFFFNVLMFVLSLFVFNKSILSIIVWVNIILLGSMWTLKKNEHSLNAVIATNKLAKEVNKLIK